MQSAHIYQFFLLILLSHDNVRKICSENPSLESELLLPVNHYFLYFYLFIWFPTLMWFTDKFLLRRWIVIFSNWISLWKHYCLHHLTCSCNIIPDMKQHNSVTATPVPAPVPVPQPSHDASGLPPPPGTADDSNKKEGLFTLVSWYWYKPK